MSKFTQPNDFDPYEPRKGVDLYSEVASRIVIPSNIPYLIYGIGIARSGTTVSLNVMTSSVAEDAEGNQYPILGSYQHFKAGYRHAMHGWPNDTGDNKWSFEIPDASTSPTFYVKDPLGPYTHTESIYNPLTLLKMVDYPKNKLFLLFFFRDPKEILASWMRNWGEVRDSNILRKNLITSCHTLRLIREQAANEGYANDTYLYESIRDHKPAEVIGRLFDKINEHMSPNMGIKLTMTEHTTGGWNPEEKKRIWHPDEPAIYKRKEISGLHDAAKTSQSLSYKRYSDNDLKNILSPQDIQELENENVYDDYEYFRRRYIESSGLEVRRPKEINSLYFEGNPRPKERK